MLNDVDSDFLLMMWTVTSFSWDACRGFCCLQSEYYISIFKFPVCGDAWSGMFLRREVCNSAGSKRCSVCKNESSTNSCHDSAWSRMHVSRAADCYRVFFAILLLTIWLEKWDLRLDDQCKPRPKNHPKITCGFISLILGNRFLQHGGQFFRILGTNSKGRDPGMGLL